MLVLGRRCGNRHNGANNLDKVLFFKYQARDHNITFSMEVLNLCFNEKYTETRNTTDQAAKQIRRSNLRTITNIE